MQYQLVKDTFHKYSERNTREICHTDLWASKYHQIVLRNSSLQKIKQDLESSKRQLMHQRVSRFFKKEPNQDLNHALSPIQVYFGINEIMAECLQESKSIRDLSLELSSSSSRERDNTVLYKKRRQQRLQDEVQLMIKESMVRRRIIRAK